MFIRHAYVFESKRKVSKSQFSLVQLIKCEKDTTSNT